MSSDPFRKDVSADYEVLSVEEEPKNNPDTTTILKHLGLFLLTLFSVTMTGANFVGFDPVLFPFAFPSTPDMLRGLLFAVLLLGFLTVHEFGHYFAAVYHKVKVTLPYYIPIPAGVGTMGAVIRIKERINRMYKLFDVGASGPIAGFVVALAVLLIGFVTLPEPDYITNFAGHEALKEYVAQNGTFPQQNPETDNGAVLTVGNTLLYSFLASFFDNVPPMWEMYHYPFLFAGWLGLFFTALNLMPVGQLDGGHILYSLIGHKKHRIVARIFFSCITVLAGIEVLPWLYNYLMEFNELYGSVAWVAWAGILYLLMNRAFKREEKWVYTSLLISVASSSIYLFFDTTAMSSQPSFIWVVWSFFIAFMVGAEHPPIAREEKLSTSRQVIGWLSMLIFILCISPNPLYIN
ncbi:MAG: site-2 protease family protein [Balneolaceae bacterium]|nr:site-2 protease family protein [Balneolaceae bacterium]